MLEPPAGLTGNVELVVAAEDPDPERRYCLTIADGRVEINERELNGQPDAIVSGQISAWVRALGPDGATDELEMEGDSSLAHTLLSGFSQAAQRTAAAA